MGLKMFLALGEQFAGADAFADAKPVVFVIGRVDEPIDARGADVFFLGSCAEAEVREAGKTIRIDKCFTTASDMTFAFGHRLGIPAITKNPSMMASLVRGVLSASVRKVLKRRYSQDVLHFVRKKLERRI